MMRFAETAVQCLLPSRQSGRRVAYEYMGPGAAKGLVLREDGSVEETRSMVVTPALSRRTEEELEEGVGRMILQAARTNPRVRPDQIQRYYDMADLLVGERHGWLLKVGGEVVAVPEPEYVGVVVYNEEGESGAVVHNLRGPVRIVEDAPDVQWEQLWRPGPMPAGNKAEKRRKRVAEAAARSLLYRWLSRDQKRDLERVGRFEVTGSDGRRFRIHQWVGGNVEEMGDSGEWETSHCVVPEDAGSVPVHDLMLAQKVLIESDVEAFRKTAVTRSIKESLEVAEAMRRTRVAEFRRAMGAATGRRRGRGLD